jgi:hypothetical protein
MEIFILIGILCLVAIIPLSLAAGGIALILGAVQKIFYNR